MRECAMTSGLQLVAALVIVMGPRGPLCAEEPTRQPTSPKETTEPHVEKLWMRALPVPADPELEQQIKELQEALGTIDTQMVRRKDLLQKTQDPATKTSLYEELERLRKEREALEKLLHDLIDEAKVSEQTAIDQALTRARWLERQQESWEKKEELLRDRQQ